MKMQLYSLSTTDPEFLRRAILLSQRGLSELLFFFLAELMPKVLKLSADLGITFFKNENTRYFGRTIEVTKTIKL